MHSKYVYILHLSSGAITWESPTFISSIYYLETVYMFYDSGISNLLTMDLNYMFNIFGYLTV